MRVLPVLGTAPTGSGNDGAMSRPIRDRMMKECAAAPRGVNSLVRVEAPRMCRTFLCWGSRGVRGDRGTGLMVVDQRKPFESASPTLFEHEKSPGKDFLQNSIEDCRLIE